MNPIPTAESPAISGKRFIADDRMLQLMAEVMAKGDKDIRTKKAFMQTIGANPNSLSAIQSGRFGFTAPQYLRAAIVFKRSLDWIFGLTDRPYPPPLL